MRIDDFAEAVHVLAVHNGFYEEPLNIDQKLMLTVSELAEAQEELRSGHKPTDLYYRDSDGKPEGFGMELADAVICIFDLAKALDIDIEAYLIVKHGFNIRRPYKHERQF